MAKMLSEGIREDLERKCEIDTKIAELRSQYQENETFDWESLCRDHNIWYYETKKAVVPIAFSMTNLSVPSWVIFNYPSWFRSCRDNSKAHEFGHALLDKETEEEAIYFSEKLTGIREGSLLLDIGHSIEKFIRLSVYPGDPKNQGANLIYYWILFNFAKDNPPVHPNNLSEEELSHNYPLFKHVGKRKEK